MSIGYLCRWVISRLIITIGDSNMTPRIVISLLGTCSSSSSSSSGGMSGVAPYKPFLSMVSFLRFLEIDFEGDNRRKEKGTPELLFVCNDGKTIEEQKHNNHYLYIICSSYAWPSLKVIWPVHTAVQPPQPHYFFVPTKASVVVVVHTSNGRRSSRGPELLTQKKRKNVVKDSLKITLMLCLVKTSRPRKTRGFISSLSFF